MTAILDVVREHLLDASAETAAHIAWNHTGYPGFFHGDPVTAFRAQVAAFVHLGPVDEYDDDGCWPDITMTNLPVSLVKSPPPAVAA